MNPDDRDLDPRRDAPAQPRLVPCAGCGYPVRVLAARPGEVRVYCHTCSYHGTPIHVTGTL